LAPALPPVFFLGLLGELPLAFVDFFFFGKSAMLVSSAPAPQEANPMATAEQEDNHKVLPPPSDTE
jgi:hypothetical protein